MSGRGKAHKTISLIAAAKVILEEIQPSTVRAVCYRLFIAGITENMSKGETQRVSKALVYARENNIIPWSWVVDDSREKMGWRTFANLAEYGENVVKSYHKDFWQLQPERVEVWSEKGTVIGTLRPVLNDFAVEYRILHGYGGTTALHNAAVGSNDHDRPLNILYVGDWDPSGLHMSNVDIPGRLERYGGNAIVRRVALTNLDCTPDLPSFAVETKLKDPRHRWFRRNFGDRCWELDAMPPPVLRKRVQQAIEAQIDFEIWNHCAIVEAAELESVRGFRWT